MGGREREMKIMRGIILKGNRRKKKKMEGEGKEERKREGGKEW